MTGATTSKGVLTPAQHRALRKRQASFIGSDCIFGPGTTLAALRRRGLVAGRQPHAELTPLGERVCRTLDRKESPSE